MDQTQFRENIARLQAQTDATIARVDRKQDFLDKLFFWAVGLIVTVGGGIFWKAAQAVNRLDEHGRRIEVVEKEAKDNQVKTRESFDGLKENQIRLGASLDKLNDNQTQLRLSFDGLKENQARLGASLDKLNDNQTQLRQSFDKLNDNQTRLSTSIDQLRSTISDRLPPAPR